MRAGVDSRFPAIVMLHGLGGDESSMWALESALPRSAALIAPRAPHEQRQGGYAWLPVLKSWPPLVSEFGESVSLLENLLKTLEFDPTELILMGFSNGAAMSFAAAMTPMRGQPAGIVAAAGHLPQGELDPLREIPIYWGHGTRDDFIPIGAARQDVQRLEELGADVTYCEADIGHKLGTQCMRELESWISANYTSVKEPGT